MARYDHIGWSPSLILYLTLVEESRDDRNRTQCNTNSAERQLDRCEALLMALEPCGASDRRGLDPGGHRRRPWPAAAVASLHLLCARPAAGLVAWRRPRQ